jgi:hypothetical protein
LNVNEDFFLFEIELKNKFFLFLFSPLQKKMNNGFYQVPPVRKNEPIVAQSGLKDVAKTLYSAMTDAAQQVKDAAVSSGPAKPSGDSKGLPIVGAAADVKPANPSVTPTSPAMTESEKMNMWLFYLTIAAVIIGFVAYKNPGLFAGLLAFASFR